MGDKKKELLDQRFNEANCVALAQNAVFTAFTRGDRFMFEQHKRSAAAHIANVRKLDEQIAALEAEGNNGAS